MSYKNRTFIQTSDNIAQLVNITNDAVMKLGDFNTLAGGDSDVVQILNRLDSMDGDIVNLSDSVRDVSPNLTEAVNYVWGQHKITTDNLQLLSDSVDNLIDYVGYLSDLDDSIRGTSFALSINNLRDSVWTNIDRLDSAVGDIENLSDSVRAENSRVIDAVNFVWNYAKQIDSDQVSGNNLLGNLSTLDDSIRGTSFAISINNLRDSVLAYTDSIMGTIFDTVAREAVHRQWNNIIIDSATNEVYLDSTAVSLIDLEVDSVNISTKANVGGMVITQSNIVTPGIFTLKSTGATGYITLNSNPTTGAGVVSLYNNTQSFGSLTQYGTSGLSVRSGNSGNSPRIHLTDSSVDNQYGKLTHKGDSVLTVGEQGPTSADGALSWTGGQIAHRTASPSAINENGSDLTFVQDVSFTYDSHGHVTASSASSATITAGTYLSNTGTTINHDATTRTNTTNSTTLATGGSIDLVSSVTTNTQGHVTGANTTTVTIPSKGDVLLIYNSAGTLQKTINSYG